MTQKGLEEANKKLEELKAVAMRNGAHGQHMAAYRRQKEEVKRLTLAFAKKK